MASSRDGLSRSAIPVDGSNSQKELEQKLISRLRASGYEIRFSWLGGKPGTLCVFRGKPIVFLDPATTRQERVEFLRHILEEKPQNGPPTPSSDNDEVPQL
ncbi:MAG: hypothetical protein NZ899_03570 [Thermoguttaceae bacterium]|nr:hypothetical protein [Thermoguttaceae bacterium]MDW8078804.1 hypothetical protein [Thermoguttaceae bacterium]